MSPRIRTFFLVLVFATLAVPATASADPWASLFSTPSACANPGILASITTTDTTTVPSGWQNADVSIPFSGANTSGYEWKLSCGGAVQTTDPATFTSSGIFTFTHRGIESLTGLPTAWVEDTVQIDKTLPVDSTTTPSSWGKGTVSVPLAVSDDMSPAHGEWRLDPLDPWSTGNAAVSGTGTKTLYTSAVDSALNRSVTTTHAVKVDNTLPLDTTVTPAGWVQDVAHITLSGTDAGDQSGVATLYYQLDSDPSTPANNGDVLDITANGVHTLRTRVVDNAGNDSGWTPLRLVKVDSAGPLDATTGAPVGWYKTAPSVNVSIAATDASGSGVTRIEWRIPEGALSGDVAGAGPVPVTVTGEGIHTLQVRFTDSMNHRTPWLDHEIKIDTTLPVDRTTATSAWLPQTSLNVTVHGTDDAPGSGVASVDWKIDGVPGSAVGDTGTAVVTGTGEHVVETRVTDVAGNVSAWVPHTVRLDPTSPRNTSPTGSTAWRASSYSVVLNGEDDNSGVDSVRWRVDNGVEHVGTRAIETATVSGDGTHTLETRVRDVAGNYSAWRPEPVNIDSVAPVNTTTVPSLSVGSGHKITITGTDALSGIAGVQWQIDAGPVMTTPQATVLGAGPHVLKSKVIDNAGNASAWLVQSVTVDGTYEDSDAPIDTTTIPTGWQTGAVTVTVSADDQGGTGVKRVEWRFDGLPIDGGNNGATFAVTDDGVHDIETRAIDNAGNTSAWRSQTLKVDHTQPVDSTVISTGWTKVGSFTLNATDATSGVDLIDYRINNGAAVQVAPGTTVPLPDGTYSIGHRVYDVAGQLTGWKTDTLKIDTSTPVNTSGAAPTAWQTSALSVDLTGTDTGSGVDHAEWRIGTTADPTSGTPAVVDVDGTSTLQTRIVDKAGNASVWRSETVKVDRTKPTNTTPAVTQGWRKTNFTTTVSGSDAASGVASIQWRLDGGAITSTPAVSISAEGMHKLETRATDVAGNVGDWRIDNIGIDKVAPALAVNCGNVTAWRNTPVDCAVTADGGVSGVTSLTGATGADGTAITDGHYVVSADGAWTLSFRAVDGAGNEAVAKVDIKVDATAPGALVSCLPDAALAYTCTPSGADAGSGLVALAYSINGAAPVAIGNGSAFSATKGKVVVIATDGAGNSTTSAAVTLADRTVPKTTTVTPRSASEAVLLAGKASASARLLGQLSVSATPTQTTVDLRPLALGKGTFQFVVKVAYGKKTKTVTKTQTTLKGYSKRISVSVPAAATAKVDLTVRRKSGPRWVAHASAHAKL